MRYHTSDCFFIVRKYLFATLHARSSQLLHSENMKKAQSTITFNLLFRVHFLTKSQLLRLLSLHAAGGGTAIRKLTPERP